jgi:DNA-binding beta-propeller fold protein YncE
MGSYQSIVSVVYVLPIIGFSIYSLFVLGGTFTFHPSAPLLPLSFDIVPILLIWAFMAFPLLAAYLTLRTMRREAVSTEQSGEIRTARFNPVWLGAGALIAFLGLAFIVNFLIFSSHPKLAWEYPLERGTIAVAPDGSIYIFERNAMQILSGDGKLLKTVNLSIEPNARPEDAAIGMDGNLYVVDLIYQSVYKFDGNGNLLKSWGAPTTGTRAKLDKAALSVPRGIALDAQNNIYVVNQASGNIVKFDSNGKLVEGFGKFASRLSQPKGVALDAVGNIYVADMRDDHIKKLDANGSMIQEWGGRGNQRGAFKMISGIASDRNGFVYATDMHNHRVQKFDANGRFVTQWFTGTGFPSGPSQLKIGSDGAVYVVSEANNKLQKFVF